MINPMNMIMNRLIVIFTLCVSVSNGFAQDGWILRKSGTTSLLKSISSSDGQNVVAVGETGVVTVSHTAGVTWQVEKNVGQSKGIGNLNGVAAISDKIFCAIGNVDSVFRSTDKGDTWVGVGGNFEACTAGGFYGIVPTLYAIDFDSSMGITVAVGPAGTGVFSPDSGKHWEENMAKANFFDMDCVSMNNGAVLGATFGLNRGYIYITTDQGDDWTVFWVHKNIELYGCDNAGWTMVGAQGTIYHSNNKGYTWDSLWGGTNVNLNAVHFGNIVRGYIVGDHGTILMTTDGGYTWEKQHCPTTQNLRSIHMSDPFHGFICGDSGVILTTQNGGYYDESVDPVPQSVTGIRNYPNPFTSRTTLEVSIPHRSYIRLSIYNMLGEEIAVLANDVFDSGVKMYEWNAGETPSGVYLCKLEIGGQIITSQITLEK